eukprot:gene721-1185_t
MHGVDMLAESVNRYGDYGRRTVDHWAIRVSQLLYKLPYENYMGGTLGISPHNFELVDDYSNCFCGWGGEDDNFYQRLMHSNVSIAGNILPDVYYLSSMDIPNETLVVKKTIYDSQISADACVSPDYYRTWYEI